MPAVTTYLTSQELKKLKQIAEANRMSLYRVMRLLIQMGLNSTDGLASKDCKILLERLLELKPSKRHEVTRKGVARGRDSTHYPFLNPTELEKVKQIAESQKTTMYQVMKAIVKAGLDYTEQEISRTAPSTKEKQNDLIKNKSNKPSQKLLSMTVCN